MPKRTMYTSLTQASNATGIPKRIIKLAKLQGGPAAGFLPNNRIDWDLAEAYIRTHMNALEAGASDSLEYFKKEIARRDVVLRDLQIQKAKGDMIDPAEVDSFLTEFAIILSSTLKKKRQELASKCTGYEDVIDKEFGEIFRAIDTEIANWGSK